MIGNVDANVEQRITTVEVKLIDLECAIANLQGYEVAKQVVLPKPPRRRKALQQSKTRSSSTPSIIPQSSFDSFSIEPSTSEERQEQIDEHRNSVANTLRPGTATRSNASIAMASHPLPAQTPAENEFARLVSMLTQEQEARRDLESQLKDLQKQINELRLSAGPRGPPAPGHFATPTSNVHDSSPVSTKRHTILPFRTASPRLALMMTSSQKEHEGEETDTDDGFLDFYETPTETREYGFGIDIPRSPSMVGVM